MENIKKRASLKLPARAGVWNIISGLIARGVGVVGTPLFTRLLTPAEYGLYPHYTTWLSVLTALVTAGLTGSAIYRGLQKYSSRREEFISAATGLALTLSSALILIGIPLGSYLTFITGLDGTILLALGAEIAFSSAVALRSAILRYHYKYKSLALINLFSAVGTPLLSVMLVLLTPYRAEARIIGSLIATLIVALPAILYAARQGSLFDLGIWRYLARVNLPLVPHYLSSALILRISEIVIGREHGNAALAKYSVGISVGLALTFISNALSQASAPWILRKVSAGEHEKVRELITPALGALIAVSVILLSAAPEILAVITPPEYNDALPTVYPLALSVSAIFLSNVISSAEAYYERSARVALPTVLTAVASVGVAVIILPTVDYRLCALFTLGAYLMLVSLSSLTFKKISGERIVDGKKCALLFAFGVFYASLMFIFRSVLISRVLLAIPLFPTLYSLTKRVYGEIRE